MVMRTKVCPICGKTFETQYNQKYCSNECANISARKYAVTCECGELILVTYPEYLQTTKACGVCGGNNRTIRKATLDDMRKYALKQQDRYNKLHNKHVENISSIQQEFIDLYNANHGYEVYNQENVKAVSKENMQAYITLYKQDTTPVQPNTQELETKVVELENKVEVLTNTINKLNENFTNYMRAKENVMKLLTF